MASSTIVSSVSHVPFRRFLPHEKAQGKVVTHQDYHNDYIEDEPLPADTGMPMPLLSSEDVSVLMEAREEAERDWHNLEAPADMLYLPFAFALAARH